MELNRTPNELDRNARNGENDNWDKIEENIKRINNTVSDLVLESGGDSNLEVVQARGGKPTLNDRLNEFSSQLNEKADKYKLIGLNDLDTETLAAIEGGETTNFNIESIPKDYSVTPIKTVFMEETRNLFDGEYLNRFIGGSGNSLWISQNKQHGGETGRVAQIKVNPNTTYTIKSHEIEKTDAFRVGMSDDEPYYGEAGSTRFYLDTEKGLVGDYSAPERQYTITTNVNTNYLYVYVSSDSNEPKLQIEKGDKASSYTAPYKIKDEYIQKQIILEKKSVRNEHIEDQTIDPKKTSFFTFDTDNLFEGNYLPYVLRMGNETTMRVEKSFVAEDGSLAIINVEADTTYTIKSHDLELTDAFRIGLANRDFAFSPFDIFNLDTPIVKNDSEIPTREITITTGAESKLMFVYVSKTGKQPRLKIEKGDRATPYLKSGVIPRHFLDIENEHTDNVNQTKSKIQSLKSGEMYDVPTLEGVNSPNSTHKIHEQNSTSMYALYDALMDEYPTYITKELFTTETTGKPIYHYNFKPEQPTISRTETETDLLHFFVVSGVHGSEKAGWWCLYETMKQICKNWRNSDVLESLRWDVKFTVVPIVNVYGVDNPSDPVTFNGKINANGVDINRNFPAGFIKGTPGTIGFGGDEAMSEPETIAIAEFLTNENVDFYADFHNFSSQSDPNIFLWNISDTKRGINMSQHYFTHLSQKWKKDDELFPQENDVFFGYSSTATGGSTPPYIASLGVEGSIFEISHTMHPKGTTVQYSSEVITLGTEAQLNWLYMAYKNLVN